MKTVDLQSEMAFPFKKYKNAIFVFEMCPSERHKYPNIQILVKYWIIIIIIRERQVVGLSVLVSLVSHKTNGWGLR